MNDERAVFIDTSILIAREFHPPATRARIRDRLSRFTFTTTSEIVKQEYKRRVLREAEYLLNQLSKRGSLTAVNQHIVTVLPPQWGRKRTICLQMISHFFGSAAEEPELTERAKRYLRTILLHGLPKLERSVGHVIRDANCGCSRQPVVERTPYERYELGPNRCSKAACACGIVDFLIARRESMQAIQTLLAGVPAANKSTEISRTEDFIGVILDGPVSARNYDPCLALGDLMIALESIRIPVFYTLNGKESQHLCNAIGQSMIVCPVNPDRDETECDSDSGDWPKF